MPTTSMLIVKRQPCARWLFCAAQCELLGFQQSPPTSVAVRRSVCFPSSRTTFAVCSASSRVGARITALAPARVECFVSLHVVHSLICELAGTHPYAKVRKKSWESCTQSGRSRLQVWEWHRSAAHRCSMGSTKAAVLPEPVRAMPTTSAPARMAGIALRWMGVGSW